MGLSGPGEGAALATPSLRFDSLLYHLPQSDLPFLEALLISSASARSFLLYMLGQGSPIFHSSLKGELGIALESLQGKIDLI